MRVYLRVPDGQWCASFTENAGQDFPDGFAANFAVAHALTLGIPTLVAVVSADDEDPRTGDLLSEPVADPPPAPIDVEAFKRAVMLSFDQDEATSIIIANGLLAAWPVFSQMVDARNWPGARQIVDLATQGGALTADQRKTILGVMTEYAVPE